MKVNYHLDRTKRLSSSVLLLFIVCTIIMIAISPFTPISPLATEAWADSVIATIPVASPHHMAFNPDNGDIYVTNLDSDTVSVIDSQTNTVIGNPIPVGDRPVGIAFNADNGDLYVANQFSNTVSVIDGQTNTVTGNPIPVGDNPNGI